MKKNITLVLILVLLIQITTSVSFAESPSNWAQQDINELKSKDYFVSNSFTNYKEPITRVKFIYFASRLLEVLIGSEIEVDPKVYFEDTTDNWALKGATVGITTGTGNNHFSPDAILSREQFASMIIKTMQLGNIILSKPGGYKFSDDESISSWAKDAMYLAKENNIISGIGNDIAAPKQNATVEQCLTIINRILKNNKSRDPIDYDDTNNKMKKSINTITFDDVIYIGETIDEIPNGYGIYNLGGGYYMGELMDGVPHGFGTIVDYNAGEYYTGTYIEGNFSGIGINKTPDTTYIGWFENDEPTGYWASVSSVHEEITIKGLDNQSKIPYKDGTYVGQLANGIPHGIGTLSNKGEVYVGEWINGSFSGIGAVSTGMVVLAGEWKDNKLNGKGIEHVPLDGRAAWVYVGEWHNGKLNGHAMRVMGSDLEFSHYIGEWKEDNRNGQGRETYINGMFQEGQWLNDKFIK